MADVRGVIVKVDVTKNRILIRRSELADIVTVTAVPFVDGDFVFDGTWTFGGS